MRRVTAVSMLVAVTAIVAMSVLAADPWSHVDDYAPIMQFNTLIVDVYPTGFQGEYSGYCTYALPKTSSSGCTFQYWFYYRYDIRISREVDAAIDSVLQNVANLGLFEREIDKLFHDHDWELVEVHVPSLGAQPDYITYYAHGSSYTLQTSGWGWTAPMQGKHPVVKVITDMHASYPAGLWSPLVGGWLSPEVNLEFALALQWEHLAGYVPEIGYAPAYKTIDFSQRCRSFKSSMWNVHTESLPTYPYELPWDKGFNY